MRSHAGASSKPASRRLRHAGGGTLRCGARYGGDESGQGWHCTRGLAGDVTERFRPSFAVQLRRLLVRRLAPCVRGLAVGVLVVHLVDERRVESGLKRTSERIGAWLAIVNRRVFPLAER